MGASQLTICNLVGAMLPKGRCFAALFTGEELWHQNLTEDGSKRKIALGFPQQRFLFIISRGVVVLFLAVWRYDFLEAQGLYAVLT